MRPADGGTVLPVFVVDPRLWEPGGRAPPAVPARLPRRPAGVAGRRAGRSGPATPPGRSRAWSARSGAASVHVSADAGPYGRRRDAAVEQALGDVPLVRDRLPVRRDPRPRDQGRRRPLQGLLPVRPGLARARLAGAGAPPRRGALADRRRLRRPAGRPGHRRRAAPARPARRPRSPPGSGSATSGCSATPRPATVPGTDGTSRLSAYLKYGCIHPRTLLADLAAVRRPRARPSAASPTSWPGGSSTPTSCGTGPETAREPLDARMRRHRATTPARTPTSGSPRGRRAAPATRSSTPGCGSCSARRGCTTGCG